MTTITTALHAHTDLLQRVRTEAGEYGDDSLHTLCTLALNGDEAALSDVADSLADAADEQGISYSTLVARLMHSAGI